MVSAMWSGTWDIRRFEEIDSTNAYLARQARLGAPEGTVAVAEHQSAGRGRLDRRWEAPPGASLLVSVLFRPEFELADLHLCTVVMALAASEACRRVAGVDPVLKWPNDVLVGEEKLAGVLAEAEFGGGAGGEGGEGGEGGVRGGTGGAGAVAAVVGLGLNIDWPGPAGVGGTCLRDLGADAVDRAVLLEALLEALSAHRALLDSAVGRREVVAELRNRCATLGRRVRIELADEAVTGVATEIDDAGHLVVQTAEGPRTVSAGDVVHLRPG
jgi:BirA family transcriptional regulator, biotin operon repressor / biotin---[acetyl-CoA-carboxylase] ligase